MTTKTVMVRTDGENDPGKNNDKVLGLSIPKPLDEKRRFRKQPASIHIQHQIIITIILSTITIISFFL